MDLSELLKSINAYPIPENVILEAALKNGLDADTEVTKEVVDSSSYRLAQAEVYTFLAGAPNITQNGISFSFSDEQRNYFMKTATAIRDNEGVTSPERGQGYGYMGEDL